MERSPKNGTKQPEFTREQVEKARKQLDQSPRRKTKGPTVREMKDKLHRMN